MFTTFQSRGFVDSRPNLATRGLHAKVFSGRVGVWYG